MYNYFNINMVRRKQNHKYTIKNNQLLILTIIILLFSTNLSFSQVQDSMKMIKYSSKILYVGEELGPDVKILKEDVSFEHDSSTMYCDSAYYNTVLNYFDAFGNIEIIRAGAVDTVYLYGDTLHYSGNKKLAEVRENVRLVKDSLTLTTNNLDYKLDENIGYYFKGGVTVNGEDTLTSRNGYYYSDNDEFFFKDTVVIINPQFNMFSDTLKHNTITKTSYFLGPTEIINDSNYIYCENGWYNHEKDIAQFNKNAFLRNKATTINGDSLYYNRNNAFAKAYENVVINDTTEKAILQGNYGEYFEKPDSSLMTDRALFIKITDENDSLFMHADTLRSYKDSLLTEEDSIRIISTVLAYSHAKIYKSDFQAKSDSISYSSQDSIIELYYNPVLWSEENQLTSDFMKVITVNEEVTEFHLYDNSFIIAQSDSVRYNQILGKDMKCYIKDNELYKVDVFENSKVTYFARDDDELLIGVNKISCTNMNIYLNDRTIKKIWFYTEPKAVMYPPLSRSPESYKYPGFKWLSEFRPLNRNEVFIWKKEPETIEENINEVDIKKP